MMKRLFFTALACGAAAAASAQYRESHDLFQKMAWNEEKLNILLDTRFDLTGAIDGGDWDRSSFNGQTLKLWVAGEIVPGISYRIRHRLNKPQTALERDNLSGATDHAWVAFTAGTNWTLTVGKQSVQLGTYEYDYNPADIYLGSMIYNDFDGYKTGIDAAWTFAGQTLHFQVVNSDSPQFAAEDYQDKAFAGAFLWEGSLFEGVLNTRWGYSAFQHTESKFYHWVTLGTRLNLGGLKAELDYYQGDRTMDYSATLALPTADLRPVRDRSASVNIEHTFGKWRPFVKGVWSERHDKGLESSVYQTWGIQAVVEYYPFERQVLKDLRFHAAYLYGRTDFQGPYAALEPQNNHTILVGMRWLFKVK